MKIKKVILINLLVLLYSKVSLVFARAGDGHSSNSSQTPSSHDSYSSHTVSSHSSYPSHTVSSYSFLDSNSMLFIVIIIIVIIICYFIYKIMNSSNNNSDTYDTPQTSTRNIEPVFDLKTKLQNLKNNDPDFNPHVFLDKASTVFFQIQYAWCNRNMDPVREYVSESIFLRFSLQIQQYLKNHKINKLDELSLDHINIIDITSDENFDTIFVAITATARDYVTDDQDNMISGSNTLTSWNEKWEFIRSTKAKTILKDGTQTIKCPNCGAPIQLNTSSECEYCHSRLIQSDFDWIISEIIQLD